MDALPVSPDRISRLLSVELAGDRCRCGRPKQPGQTFCRRCFYLVSAEARRALYLRSGTKSLGAGYEVAYVRAVRLIRVTHPALMEVPDWAETIDPAERIG